VDILLWLWETFGFVLGAIMLLAVTICAIICFCLLLYNAGRFLVYRLVLSRPSSPLRFTIYCFLWVAFAAFMLMSLFEWSKAFISCWLLDLLHKPVMLHHDLWTWRYEPLPSLLHLAAIIVPVVTAITIAIEDGITNVANGETRRGCKTAQIVPETANLASWRPTAPVTLPLPSSIA